MEYLRPREQLFCSFCGKDQATVKALIAGPSVFICNECIAICAKCLDGQSVSSLETNWSAYPEDILLNQLARSSAIADAANDLLASHVENLRQRGVKWAAIGRALGVSRQAAWERFS